MDVRKLKRSAGRSLQMANAPRGLAALHCLAVVIFELILVVISYALDRGIAGTGGLSGMGTRSVLTTAQMFLQVLLIVLLPFWQMGITRMYLQWNRREEANGGTLLSGFRRFGPILGLKLLQFFLLLAVFVLCSQFATTLYTVTPQGAEFMKKVEPYLMESEGYLDMLERFPVEEFMGDMKPILLVFTLTAVPVSFFVFFMIRLASFVIMDDEPSRPFRAALRSVKMLRKNMGAFLRLDLSYWWYYLLQVFMMALGYADIVLLKIGLNMDADLLFYAAFGAQVVAKLLVAGTVQAKVGTTYAAAYDELKERLALREAEKAKKKEEIV